MRFEPASRTVNLSADMPGLDFTATRPGPEISNGQAVPDELYAGETVFLTVRAGHASGQGAISSVAIDLSAIGGSGSARMYDDGTNGDPAAGDGVYSLRATVSQSTPPGHKALAVTATDTSGNQCATFVELSVTSLITDTVQPGKTQTYETNNLIDGQTIIILIEPGGNTPPPARMRDAAGGTPVVQIIRPDGTEYFDEPIPLPDKPLQVIIKNAMAGVWRYVVTNPTSTPQEFTIKTTTAGTGVVTGCVKDAASGENLANAQIMTSGSVSTVAADGFYLLVHPAGQFVMNASAAGHTSASRSFTVSAGGTVELNVALASGGDNSTCVLEDVFTPGDNAMLAVSRQFRDRVLQATAAGRSYTQLYYQYSPEVVRMVKADPGLKAMIRGCVVDILPKMLARAPLSGNDAQSIRACLEAIRAKSSGSLAAEIDTLLTRIEAGRTVREMLR